MYTDAQKKAIAVIRAMNTQYARNVQVARMVTLSR